MLCQVSYAGDKSIFARQESLSEKFVKVCSDPHPQSWSTSTSSQAKEAACVCSRLCALCVSCAHPPFHARAEQAQASIASLADSRRRRLNPVIPQSTSQINITSQNCPFSCIGVFTVHSVLRTPHVYKCGVKSSTFLATSGSVRGGIYRQKAKGEGSSGADGGKVEQLGLGGSG
ncbi:hypothetical protein BaRGS_00021134 [Batillaria attramentaria]|uniref:Uncharacterized protein n=1 Tax=Batillaria attramentaria TaxID=370345 RepID=A0ABD0KKF7_9CAEN